MSRLEIIRKKLKELRLYREYLLNMKLSNKLNKPKCRKLVK